MEANDTEKIAKVRLPRFRFSSALEVYGTSLRWRMYWMVAAALLDIAFKDHVAEGITEFERFDELHWSLRAFVKWDAAHLLNIATRGYTKDNESVFFPLYPTVVSRISQYFTRYLIVGGNVANEVVITALSINLLLYPLATVLLWKLFGTWKVSSNLKDVAITVHASINPANAFFVSCYSETMFSVATWLSMYLLNEAHDYSWLTNIEVNMAIFLASLTRSNGVINACLGLKVLQRLRGSTQVLYLALLDIITVGLSASLPLVTIDIMNTLRYCNLENPSLHYSEACGVYCSEYEYNSYDLTLPHLKGYIEGIFSTRSSYYSYIQKKYWNVDLFTSYRWKQIPNIAIAMPTIVVAWYVLFVARSCRRRFKVERLHLLFHLTLAVTFAHIQITTRLLMCACPLMYLGIAEILEGNSSVTLKAVVVVYLALFSVAGVGLQVNWYPWT